MVASKNITSFCQRKKRTMEKTEKWIDNVKEDMETRTDPVYPPNLKSVALPVPEIRGVAKLQTPNLEEGEAVGGRG